MPLVSSISEKSWPTCRSSPVPNRAAWQPGLPPTDGAIQLMDAPAQGDQVVIGLADEASHTMGHHLGYRATTPRHHRRATGQRLSHHQAERLRPVDRIEQGDRVAEKLRLVVV